MADLEEKVSEKELFLKEQKKAYEGYTKRMNIIKKSDIYKKTEKDIPEEIEMYTLKQDDIEIDNSQQNDNLESDEEKERVLNEIREDNNRAFGKIKNFYEKWKEAIGEAYNSEYMLSLTYFPGDEPEDEPPKGKVVIFDAYNRREMNAKEILNIIDEQFLLVDCVQGVIPGRDI